MFRVLFPASQLFVYINYDPISGQTEGGGRRNYYILGLSILDYKSDDYFQQNSIVENNRLGVGKIEMSC